MPLIWGLFYVEAIYQMTTNSFSPYIHFTREEWRQLRASTPLSLSEADVKQLQGINEHLSLDEISDIYLPLSRLLNLYVEATQELYKATSTFLGNKAGKVPYVIGIAGSVAVGKSTTARILQALLSQWPSTPKVDLVTTDGFLYPNRILEQRGLMKRKGFPESYDIRKLIRFLADVKSGRTKAVAPVYSHLAYDIVPDEFQVVEQPDIVIVEGLNVLQTASADASSAKGPRVYVSDFFDFSLYVDAKESDITQWYVDRFKILRNTAFKNPLSYFHRYSSLTDEESSQTALQIWFDINAVNLRENILPTKTRAQLILEKGSNHLVSSIKLRKI